MDEINEKSTGLVVLSFFNELEEPIVPLTLSVAITDVLSGTAIQALTAVSPAPSGTTHDLIVTALQNAILNTTNEQEERVISVLMTYSGGKQATDQYHYVVKNVPAVT